MKTRGPITGPENIKKAHFQLKGDEVKNRKKQRKVETEVADLRLKLATIQSKNIVLSNREIRLLR